MAKERKLTKRDETIKYVLRNPRAPLKEIAKEIGASLGLVSHIRAEMARKGMVAPLTKHSTTRGSILPKFTPPVKIETLETDQILDGEMVKKLAESENILEDIDLNDDEMQKKLLKQVQLMAFDASLHPDTRLNAINIYAKVKDIAKAKDLGPGPPRNEEQIIERLVRIMRAVGPSLTVKSVHYAFPTGEPSDDKETDKGETSNPVAEAPSPV